MATQVITGGQRVDVSVTAGKWITVLTPLPCTLENVAADGTRSFLRRTEPKETVVVKTNGTLGMSNEAGVTQTVTHNESP